GKLQGEEIARGRVLTGAQCDYDWWKWAHRPSPTRAQNSEISAPPRLHAFVPPDFPRLSTICRFPEALAAKRFATFRAAVIVGKWERAELSQCARCKITAAAAAFCDPNKRKSHATPNIH
ncbi:hypothetical protein KI387_001483, partial [Taxus chinensis]